MRVKKTTQRFQMFVRDLQERFWGDFQGRMREVLRNLLETDAEQRMAEYLGLQWHERAPAGSEWIIAMDFTSGTMSLPWGCFACAFPAHGSGRFCRAGSGGSSDAPRKWPN